MNGAAKNTSVQVSRLLVNLHSFRYMSRSGTGGSHGRPIFNILRNFHSGCMNLHSYQQHIRVPFSLHTDSSTFVVCFLDNDFDWGKMESRCSFVCISFMAKDLEHF
jgi:hypothetical protein